MDMQNLTAHTITMEDTVRMIVVEESFAFPEAPVGAPVGAPGAPDTDATGLPSGTLVGAPGATVFSFHGVLRADFTNGCEISLHLSVYDANPSFV